jgi:hypothetical protein
MTALLFILGVSISACFTYAVAKGSKLFWAIGFLLGFMMWAIIQGL